MCNVAQQGTTQTRSIRLRWAFDECIAYDSMKTEYRFDIWFEFDIDGSRGLPQLIDSVDGKRLELSNMSIVTKLRKPNSDLRTPKIVFEFIYKILIFNQNQSVNLLASFLNFLCKTNHNFWNLIQIYRKSFLRLVNLENLNLWIACHLRKFTQNFAKQFKNDKQPTQISIQFFFSFLLSSYKRCQTYNDIYVMSKMISWYTHMSF